MKERRRGCASAFGPCPPPTPLPFLPLQATSGSLQSLCWASAAVGGIVSAYFSGSLVEDYGTRYWQRVGKRCRERAAEPGAIRYVLYMMLQGPTGCGVAGSVLMMRPPPLISCAPNFPLIRAHASFNCPLCPDRFVFSITALFPLIVSLSALLIDEKPVYRSKPGGKQQYALVGG